MDAGETRQEIRRPRYRAEQWRVIIKQFSDAKMIETLAETAAELEQKADRLAAELASKENAGVVAEATKPTDI